jgi:methyltransferase (TIGR00027 family)
VGLPRRLHREEPLGNDLIRHLSDTALWVAACRAIESERPDALFRDPLAARLAGERGRRMATTMPDATATQWSVAIRTVVIDRFLTAEVAAGADSVLSLGAGFDARPYRLDLPTDLAWIEVDYPDIVRTKEELLAGETAACRVERVGLDLAERDARRRLFARIGGTSQRTVILTEGVVPYLTPPETADLAADLHAQPSFDRWVTDYFSPVLLAYLKRRRPRSNAPFRFDPPDWEAFFAAERWRPKEMRYLGEESLRLGRRVPMPLQVHLMRPFLSRSRRAEMRRMTGYALLARVDRTAFASPTGSP